MRGAREMKRRGRCGAFSLVEVLLGAAIGLIIVALSYEWLTSSSRILARGQNKMTDTNQAELVDACKRIAAHAVAQEKLDA